MRLTPRRHPTDSRSGVTGTARVDRRTASVLRRLRPGDIAVVDHLDLDRAHAEALVATGAAAVVNAVPFISGRYPNLGPEHLVRSGVLLVDNVGPEVFGRVREGASLRLQEGRLYLGDEMVAHGRALDADTVRSLMDGAREGLFTQLQSLTHNTTEFLRREQELFLHGQGAPETVTALTGRPVVVVVPGPDSREELRRIRQFVREQRPVLVGVDGGADVLLAARHTPDIVVVGENGLGPGSRASDDSTVSDAALKGARDVVLHTDRSGRAMGSDRLDRLGARPLRFPASSATQDVALLLADLSGASLIVAVGSHASLDEFLDQHRAGLASTFLTRLRLGPRLVDSSSVAALYAGRVRLWQLLLVLVAGVLAMLVALAATPVGSEWWTQVQDWLVGLRDQA